MINLRKFIKPAFFGGVVIVTLGGWWWSNSHNPSAPAGMSELGGAEKFEALDCQARYFESSPALAIVFAAPLDTRQNFAQRISVLDLGDAKPGRGRRDNGNSDEDSAPSAKRGHNPPTPSKPAVADATSIDAAKNDKTKIVDTRWIVGDNPRTIYLPHVQPGKRYRVALKADVAGGTKETLGKDLVCEITAEAMPPSFYFASRGTVLPAKQNGGLPIVTINVPEVDVQFLRVEPSQLPRFLERIVGRKAKLGDADATNTANNDDDEGYYDYGRPRGPQGALQSYELDTFKGLARSVYLGRFVADARENRRNITHLPVEEIKELQEPGIYIAVMNQPGRFRQEYQTTYFYVSDIGIQVRRYSNGLDAYATSLRSGQAIRGTEFQLLDENGKSIGRAETDSDGHAHFGLKPNLARVITAKRGSEFSLLSLIEPALDLSEFDIGGHLPRPTKIFVYAGRDLYRPGESFEATFIVRGPDGQALLPAPIAATLKRADGKAVQQFVIKADEKRPGYMQRTIQLPQDAQTGTWTLESRADPAAKAPDSVMRIQVEEFLPERMKLELKSAQPYLTPGDKFDVDVVGTYLYGAPAAGNRLMGNVVTERSRSPFPKQWPGFEFGDFDDDSIKSRSDLESTTLENDGTTTVSVPSPKKETRSPLSVRASLSLLESGGRPVVRSIERIVFPAEKLIGLRPLWSGKFVQEGSNAELEVIRSTREGAYAPLQKAILRVFREDRDYYWAFDDQRGWHSGFNDSDELIDSREFDLSKRTKINFPVKYGRYRVEVLDRETGLAARYRLYAGWGAQDAELVGNRPDRVQLKLDKPGYAVGDKARLTIAPPHDGEALVLVEGGEGVLYQERVSVSTKGTTINIPISKDWNRHDMYISAAVFRPGSNKEKITPARALGLVYLPIDREDRKLAVKLTAPDKIQPNMPLKVRIKVEGLNSETATVTLSAVDIGILNITNFVSPDPFDFFLGKHRYAPDVLDIYGKFIETMEGTKGKLKFGGDAKMRDTKSTPKKVLLVDLFSGPVALNAQGEAEIALNVPDFNGTLRLMAVATSATHFGKADIEVISAAPIVAELAMPRFLSPGDKATVTLDVTNMTEVAQTLKVGVTAIGPVKVTGDASSVQLKPQQKKTLRFVAEATDAVGVSKIVVNVRGSGKGKEAIAIKREAALFISPLTPPERTRRFQRIAPHETVKLDAALVDGLFAGSALVSATLSTTPPINVADQVKGLLGYPYGCLEQTTSRAFPHVLLDNATAISFGLKPFTQAEREKAIDQAISRISGLQRASGAFTLWGNESGGGVDEPWLTAYVSEFLKTARAAGYAVPDAMVKRADEYMLKQLQQVAVSFPPKAARSPAKNDKDGNKDGAALPDDSITRDSSWWSQYQWREADRNGHRRFGALAYMGYVLALDERAPLAALRTLYDDYKDRALSPLPLAQLSIALKRMGDQKRAGAALDLAFATPYGMTGYEWEWLGDYGTPLRDTAMMFAILEKNNIQHKRKDNLISELAQMVPRARWLSTQEQTALLVAAKQFGTSSKDSWQANVMVAGKVEALTSKATEMHEFDVAKLKSGVSVTNTNKDAIYLAIETVGYPLKPREAKDDLISMRRTLYTTAGVAVGERALKVGEQLMVHLEVTTKRRIEDGLVVDRIPAGLEIENMNLSQGSRMGDITIKPPQRSDGYYGKRSVPGPAEAMADVRIKHREFRDDRFVVAARLEGTLDLYYLVRVVTPGQFVIPPSFAEDMYRPEVRGLGTVGGVLRVEDAR